MKRSQLYKDVLAYILQKHSGLQASSEEYMDIDDYIHNGDFVEAIEWLFRSNLSDSLRPLINTCKRAVKDENVNMDEEIPPKSHKIKLFKKHSHQRYARNLIFLTIPLSVIETKQLYLDGDDIYDGDVWLLLEKILIDRNRREKIVKELINHSHPNTFILSYQKTPLGLTQDDDEKLYSFALISQINKKQVIKIPEELIFSWGTSPFIPTLSYNENVNYQEFYDIYDVFNDWLHAKDILTAFIKMYQIAEYMIYRSQMVEIISRSEIKQSFLREIKNLSDKYRNGERDTIIRNFPNLFNGFTLDPAKVTASWPFIDKYFDKNYSGNHYLDYRKPPNEIDKGVARLVYDVRCSIIHNKESEFHIQYNNYEEYKSIIPLLTSINEQMAGKILAIICTPNSSVHYEKRVLELY